MYETTRISEAAALMALGCELLGTRKAGPTTVAFALDADLQAEEGRRVVAAVKSGEARVRLADYWAAVDRCREIIRQMMEGRK
ncbi:hypothetical protein [Pseudomonas sp.]|uniref:hypothetical protein n=1 Tax=Pseudomonas sp. TaxID=306 RepID=UPI003D0A41EA